MEDVKFQKIVEAFFPPAEKRVAIDAVVEGCQKRNIPIMRRTLQDFSTKGMLPKPIRIGRNSYYEEGIFDKVAALFILKDVFYLSHKQISDMLRGGASSVTEIVDVFYRVLSSYFNWEEGRNNRALIFEVVNTKKSDDIVKKMVEDITEGLEPASIKAQEYVKEFKTIVVKRKA